jgi:threonine dehydrogenase-like Zn-dependent dehydrogenase
VPERRELAENFGARGLDLDDRVRDRLAAATAGRGVDCVLEMVGAPEATRLAVDLLRPGGTLAAAGVHTEPHFAFSPGEAYDKNLTYRAGRCSARAYMAEALTLAADPRFDLASIATERTPLADAADAYERFDKRAGGCVKVILLPA